MGQRTCAGCGVEIVPGLRERNRRKWCSERCRVAAYRRQNPEYVERLLARSAERRAAAALVRSLEVRPCAGCGEDIAAPGTRRYCSPSCRSAAYCRRNDYWSRPEVRERRREFYSDPERRRRYRVKDRARESRREALERMAPSVDFTAEALASRLSMFAGCWICGSVLDEFHIDHVKPLSKGGWHCLSNLRPCCPSCNLRKGAKWPITEFVTSIRTESVVAS